LGQTLRLHLEKEFLLTPGTAAFALRLILLLYSRSVIFMAGLLSNVSFMILLKGASR
jgi:hypothetical protein